MVWSRFTNEKVSPDELLEVANTSSNGNTKENERVLDGLKRYIDSALDTVRGHFDSSKFSWTNTTIIQPTLDKIDACITRTLKIGNQAIWQMV